MNRARGPGDITIEKLLPRLGCRVRYPTSSPSNVIPAMSPRGYHHLCPPDLKTNSIDEIVQYYEFVRINMRMIRQNIPPHYEFDLKVGGSPHCDGLVPMLGIYIPGDVPNRFDFFELDDAIEEWLEQFEQYQLYAEIKRTQTPTYNQLCEQGVHPIRQPGNA